MHRGVGGTVWALDSKGRERQRAIFAANANANADTPTNNP
jgi:hypothetical protein